MRKSHCVTQESMVEATTSFYLTMRLFDAFQCGLPEGGTTLFFLLDYLGLFVDYLRLFKKNNPSCCPLGTSADFSNFLSLKAFKFPFYFDPENKFRKKNPSNQFG